MHDQFALFQLHSTQWDNRFRLRRAVADEIKVTCDRRVRIRSDIPP